MEVPLSAPAAAPPVEPQPEPLLRTLAPLLRGLERRLSAWIDAPHRYPMSMIDRARLEGLAADLRRQADALDVDRPLLVVMLMGGTGVGKSTLLNALAGGPIAQASFTRPTTRDPVVYYHESVKPDRFDPALRHCRLVQHDREGLAQKIIVDTPDLDSTELANREKLIALLPVADIVLYVGSQEKYHDKLGWDLFKEQRRRRAFAFVLNKWDRCIRPGETGRRPDEDLLLDLKSEGFDHPLLFRTVAQSWLDFETSPASRNGQAEPPGLPEGEQFRELSNWLEWGLTRLEIEAIKARGVEQLLIQLGQILHAIRPPDLTEEAERTREAWKAVLDEEAGVYADVLLSTLEPYQSEIEHHFRVQGQQKFSGLMASYLKLVTRVRYASTSLRGRIPFVPRAGAREEVEAPSNWNLAAFVHECTRVAGERVLNKRGTALVNRLLVEADRKQFPLNLLNHPTTDAARMDWHERYDRALMDALAEVERIYTQPTGMRRLLRGTLIGMANLLPGLVLIGATLVLFWRYFYQGQGSIFDMLLPFAATLATLVLMQMLIALLLPLRWATIRGDFHEQLRERLGEQLDTVYAAIPGEVAEAVLAERRQVDQLLDDLKQVDDWLEQRQRAATVAALYGSEPEQGPRKS